MRERQRSATRKQAGCERGRRDTRFGEIQCGDRVSRQRAHARRHNENGESCSSDDGNRGLATEQSIQSAMMPKAHDDNRRPRARRDGVDDVCRISNEYALTPTIRRWNSLDASSDQRQELAPGFFVDEERR